MKPFLFILYIILVIPAFAAGDSLKQPETIRVALMKGAESIRLEGNGVLATDESGEPVRAFSPLLAARIRDGVMVNGKALRRLTVTAPQYVKVNGKKYRGIVDVTPADKGLLVVNELPLEDYLIGLINCEISSQWPMEAIKAQAVIARSYAVYQKESRKSAPYHLESTVMDQVYDGCEVEDSRAARGVRETAGVVLTYDNKVIQAFYHSNCGGHTEATENVWGIPMPYLRGVDCEYCLKAPSAKWELTLPLKRVEALLRKGGYQVGGLREIRIGRKNKSGRVTDVTLISGRGRFTLSAVSLRKAIGYSAIKSTNFEVRMTGNDVLFSGIGYGHGVGLCQWGAKQRALDGFDYREILSYYYPGARLEKLYGE
ncbi:MAG TPA: SpoIID/LytB domain-containing protein [Geobacteraceae bacterium]